AATSRICQVHYHRLARGLSKLPKSSDYEGQRHTGEVARQYNAERKCREAHKRGGDKRFAAVAIGQRRGRKIRCYRRCHLDRNQSSELWRAEANDIGDK